jgi:hypothetical protein
MKITGLDGQVYNWNLSGHQPLRSEEVGSSYHTRCRELLAELFPTESRLEELPLPGSGGLTADFFLPLRRMIIEVHGQQHYEYVQHFHHNRLGFLRSIQRDQRKQQWCDLNSIRFVELPWNEGVEQWRLRILCREQTDGGND